MRRRDLLASMAAAGVGGGALTVTAGRAETVQFPAGFVWGTATSSYQVEGRGDRQADTIWDSFARAPGAIVDHSNGDIACDHYHRYADDLALMAKAGVKAYRFSISWARVLPTGSGGSDPRGLDFYSRLTDAALKAGIEPWVCLFHWDLPQALQDHGGWSDRLIADRYAEYASLMAKHLGDRVTRWVTFNEPNVHAIIGHGFGEHAPGLKSREAMFQALHHQNLAHGKGAQALRATGGDRFKLGTVLSLQPCRPADTAPASAAAAQLWDALWNRCVLDPPLLGRYPEALAEYTDDLVQDKDLAQIRQKLDFLGVNYYSPMYQKTDPAGLIGTGWGAVPEGMPRTAMDWPVDPQGLLDVLSDLRDHYGNPELYITENGACFAETVATDGRVDDAQRVAYLHDHIAVARRAIAEKVNLRGYFAWTIMDNFEWAKGYTAPFGLMHVDRATLARTPKASYDWFAKLAHSNTLPAA